MLMPERVALLAIGGLCLAAAGCVVEEVPRRVIVAPPQAAPPAPPEPVAFDAAAAARAQRQAEAEARAEASRAAVEQAEQEGRGEAAATRCEAALAERDRLLTVCAPELERRRAAEAAQRARDAWVSANCSKETRAVTTTMPTFDKGTQTVKQDVVVAAVEPMLVCRSAPPAEIAPALRLARDSSGRWVGLQPSRGDIGAGPVALTRCQMFNPETAAAAACARFPERVAAHDAARAGK